MRAVDRGVGLGLTLLALAVLFTARAFPDVPGQKLGASFLPLLVGAGLLLCGLALVVRSRRAPEGAAPAQPIEQVLPALVVVAAIAAYVLLAERLGFLLVAPLLLLAVFKALQARGPAAIGWALGGTVVVHVVFYKLLRVPLPWGVLRPFY